MNKTFNTLSSIPGFSGLFETQLKEIKLSYRTRVENPAEHGKL